MKTINVYTDTTTFSTRWRRAKREPGTPEVRIDNRKRSYGIEQQTKLKRESCLPGKTFWDRLYTWSHRRTSVGNSIDPARSGGSIPRRPLLMEVKPDS